jgi:hypothetical protein
MSLAEHDYRNRTVVVKVTHPEGHRNLAISNPLESRNLSRTLELCYMSLRHGRQKLENSRRDKEERVLCIFQADVDF